MDIKPTLALLGCDAPKQIFDSLEGLGFSTCALPRDLRLPKPVSSHADMLIFHIGDRIFSSEGYFNDNKLLFEKIQSYGYRIIKCNVTPTDTYPYDIPFNLVRIKEHIIGKIKFAAPEIKSFAENNGIELISVNQGYAKCSTLTLGDSAVISADSSILSAAENLGLPYIKIENSPCSVTLEGYDYGFIGGACGVFQHKVYFAGNIEQHPDFTRIKDFCDTFDFELISMGNSILTDIGGIIFLQPLL